MYLNEMLAELILNLELDFARSKSRPSDGLSIDKNSHKIKQNLQDQIEHAINFLGKYSSVNSPIRGNNRFLSRC